jgi:hypothetical protein
MVLLLRFRSRQLDRIHDVWIGAASTQIAGHVLPYFGVGIDVPFADARNSGHDLTGGAISALKSVTFDECRLDRVQFVPMCEALNRRYLFALCHHGEGQARQNTSSIDMHGTRATLAMVASLFCTGQSQPVPQRIKQRDTIVDPEPLSGPVYVQCDFR